MLEVEAAPTIWWSEEAQEQLTRCLSCGFAGFMYMPQVRQPHLCPQCRCAVYRLPARAEWFARHAYRAVIAQDQGPRKVQADAAAQHIEPHTDRQAFAVTDGVGDDEDAASAAYFTAWAAAAAAVRAGAAGGLMAARQLHLERFPGWPADQLGTCVAAVAVPMLEEVGNGWDVAWCGDARAYVVAGGGMSQVTTDHTEAERLREIGYDVNDDAPAHHRVTSTITAGPIDAVRITGRCDALLLCSDGVYGPLSTALMFDVLTRCPYPHAAANRLIELARTNGGRDNATALVIRPPRG